MIEDTPFLFQSKQGTVYYVGEDGIKVVKLWSSSERIPAFADGDESNYSPNDMLRRSSVQLIVASSPRGANQRWIKLIQARRPWLTRHKLITKLWSKGELLLAGLVFLALRSTPD